MTVSDVTINEVTSSFSLLLSCLSSGIPPETQAQIVQNDLARINDSERQDAILAMRAMAAGHEHGAVACTMVNIPPPERQDPGDTVLGGVVADLLRQLQDLQDSPERDNVLTAIFGQMAEMTPVTRDRYRTLLMDRAGIRGGLIDEELRRRRNGHNPSAEPDDDETRGPGRTRKPKLTTDEYIELYRRWGHDARLNLCNDDVEIDGEILTDVIEDQIKAKVRDYGIDHYISTNVQHASEALVTMGARRAYHPVKDYLESLQWDGGQHIAELAGHFTDKEGQFSRWFEHWAVGSVARVYESFQNPMLVLDGPQDAGKSYFARWLCPLETYFLESPIYPENKDHKLRLIQTWIWEVSELGTTTRKADVEALKAFLTMQTVRERKAYGRRDIVKPALASFIGTINNESGFLVDRTGNRRFLVCTLESIDWSYSEDIDVNQVWAEALHRYRTDDSWQLTAEEKTDRDVSNEEYLVDDPIEVYILKNYEFTDDVGDLVLLEQLLSSLDMYNIRPTRGTTMAISSVMKKYGALKKREMLDGTQQRLYRRVKAKPKKEDGQNTGGDDDHQDPESAADEIAELGF